MKEGCEVASDRTKLDESVNKIELVVVTALEGGISLVLTCGVNVNVSVLATEKSSLVGVGVGVRVN